MAESEREWFLTEDQKPAAKQFWDEARLSAVILAAPLEDTGMPEEEALSTAANHMMFMAAQIAIGVRINILHGMPDREKWLDVANRAFDLAVENVDHFKMKCSVEPPLEQGESEDA